MLQARLADRADGADRLGLGCVGLVLAALGASPLGVFAALGEGAFGSWYGCVDTLVKSTPLIFTGLAVSIAFSGALWNIGADGQLTIQLPSGAGGTPLSDGSYTVTATVAEC